MLTNFNEGFFLDGDSSFLRENFDHGTVISVFVSSFCPVAIVLFPSYKDFLNYPFHLEIMFRTKSFNNLEILKKDLSTSRNFICIKTIYHLISTSIRVLSKMCADFSYLYLISFKIQ